MKVVAHEPQIYFALEDGEGRYLDINCTRSFVSFPFLLKLTDEEYAEWHALGTVYLTYLARRVNYWVDRYADRKVEGELLIAADRAIAEWMALHPDSAPDLSGMAPSTARSKRPSGLVVLSAVLAALLCLSLYMGRGCFALPSLW